MDGTGQYTISDLAELFLSLDRRQAVSEFRLLTLDDSLRLSFVYDDDSTGYNEILQIEEQSRYRSSKRNAARFYY